MLRQQLLGVFIGFLHALETIELFFFENGVSIGFHPGGKRQAEERFRIFGSFLHACSRQLTGTREGAAKVVHASGVRLAFDSVQKPFFIEEEIAGQDILPIKFFE